ncbi:MAG: metallophosphoesterase [Tepidisphaeraceae bacterium]
MGRQYRSECPDRKTSPKLKSMFFVVLISAMLVGDVLWWQIADRRIRAASAQTGWRIVLGVFVAFQIAYMLFYVVAPREARRPHAWLPVPVVATAYIWHLVVMPASLVVAGLLAATRLALRLLGPKPRQALNPGSPSRREILVGAATSIPPLLAIGGAIRAIPQLGELRVRRIDVPLSSLPRELDGITIAHVSDTHIGRFTRHDMLDRFVAMTNDLRADLVLFTGDLIDLSLSDLPRAIAMMRRLDPRGGLFICEGNHDLIESRAGFETAMKHASMPLLLDETATVVLRGVPIQIIGARWSRGQSGMPAALTALQTALDPRAFPILLAHHPHLWDLSAVPLTLSGHTHGGQLMLNERLGAGPVIFRYWSGLYRRNGQALVVNNGAGNWFPLRIHAPAEIIRLTLRRV